MQRNKISYINYSEAKKLDELLINRHQIPMKQLIQEAGQRISHWIDHHVKKKKLIGVVGKGNNGKDILSAFLQLSKEYELYIYLCNENTETCHLYTKLKNNKKISQINKLPKNIDNTVIIDGIFGTGLNRPISKPIQQIINDINNAKCQVIAIDIPSGLKEDGVEEGITDCIIANTTLTMMLPKTVFLNRTKKELCGDIYLMNFKIPKEDLHPLQFPNTIESYIKL